MKTRWTRFSAASAPLAAAGRSSAAPHVKLKTKIASSSVEAMAADRTDEVERSSLKVFEGDRVR
ncbi:MAG TPA: hypothetical protein VFW87_16385, partial [Pirellulales bacterium]|nr:hypothetical protein [Pirellulales bacterium]